MPSIVGGVKVVSQLHDNKYRIVWNSYPGISYYNIYRAGDPYNTFTKIISVATATQYFDELPADWSSKNVFYKVTAVDSVGAESDLTSTPAITDTDVNSYMYVPKELNIKQYNYNNQVEWLYNIVPFGTINGTNNVFYFNYNYKSGSLDVFKNRKKLNASEFVEVSSNSFSLTTTPTVGDTLDCNFIKY